MSRAAGRKKAGTGEVPFVQFSKKLITGVMIFWGIIRLVSVIAALINPESATHMAAIVAGVDEIAMVNTLAYTGNSVSEKIAIGYFDMRKHAAEKDGNEKEPEDSGEGAENG